MRLDYKAMAHLRPSELPRHQWRQMLRQRLTDSKAMAFVPGTYPNRHTRKTVTSLLRRRGRLSKHERQLLKALTGADA